MGIINQIILTFSIFLSLFCGVFLAYHTCEELSTISKIIKNLKFILFFSIFTLIDYLFLGISLGFTIVFIWLVIIFLVAHGLKQYYSIIFENFSKILKYLDIVIFALILSIFIITKSLILGSLIFIIGLIIGTIETKDYLFHKYENKKFTTQTVFSKKDRIKMYINALKIFHWVLYPAMVMILLTNAI